MRTSFHHQPEAQHPNFPLSVSWQADYPIFRGEAEVLGRRALITSVEFGPMSEVAQPRLQNCVTCSPTGVRNWS
jgi:hypothetical protein